MSSVDQKIKFVDLFACGGGASTGAKAAGYVSVLAVDFDPDALAIHKANNKDCAHLVLEVGTPESTAMIMNHSAFPKAGKWHLHMSPPCNNLCGMNKAAHGGDADGREQMDEEGMRLVKWSLDFLLKAKPTTWSFENVNNSKLIDCLETFRKAHPTLCDFDVFHFEDFGLPADRIRILAGTPERIKRFAKLPMRKCTTSRVFAAEGWELPARYISGSCSQRNRRVSTQAYTVTSVGLTFRNKRNSNKRNTGTPMTPMQLGRMQTFPASYDWCLDRTCTFKLPTHQGIKTSQSKALCTVGNAFPPLIAALLLGATYETAKAAGLLLGRGETKSPGGAEVEEEVEEEGSEDDTESDDDQETLANRKRRIAVSTTATEDSDSDDSEDSETLAQRQKRAKTSVHNYSLAFVVGMAIGGGHSGTSKELKTEMRRIAPSLEFNEDEIKAVLEAHKALLG